MKDDYTNEAFELINAYWEEPECKHARHMASEKKNIEITQTGRKQLIFASNQKIRDTRILLFIC